MTEVGLTLIFNHLGISQQLPRLLIPPKQKQFRQMELQIAISVNNHLQGSQYSVFRYIKTLLSIIIIITIIIIIIIIVIIIIIIIINLFSVDFHKTTTI